MSTIDSLLHSIRRVILMESKLQSLAEGLKEISERVVDHEGRLIRLETIIDISRHRGPPLLDQQE